MDGVHGALFEAVFKSVAVRRGTGWAAIRPDANVDNVNTEIG